MDKIINPAIEDKRENMNGNILRKVNKISLFCSKACYKLHLNLLGRLISLPRINLSLKYLESKIPETLAKKYSYDNLKKLSPEEQPVFVMWFQGENSMPPIIKKCYESIKKNFTNRKIILITEENLTDYAKLPDFILDKYHSGNITRTTLSDIIRAKLLYDNGGMWIDATVFISKKIENSYFDSELYGPCGILSEKSKDWKYIFANTNGWNGWCMGSQFVNYPFFDFLYNSFLEFYKSETSVIDYFQIDFFTRLFFDYNEHFRRHIETRKQNNIQSHDIARSMNKKITKKLIYITNNLLSAEPIHKLTYKKNWDLSENSCKISSYFYNK